MFQINRFMALMMLALVVSGTTAIGLASHPNVFSGIAYAVDSGRAYAARDHLAKANDLSEAFRDVARSLKPSVVSISSKKTVQTVAQGRLRGMPDVPPEFERFFGDGFWQGFQFESPRGGFSSGGMGTGVVVREDGYVLTNNHVIDGADEVSVKLSDGREYDAEVVGSDEQTDLAVLKVDAFDLVPVEWGDSDVVDVGQWVLAIGSPFGLDQTVTAGIVSAKGRANVGVADYEDFIQTDAAINPGNSGGPLVDLAGQVVGINTAIASRTGGYMGIGFAIPSAMVHSVMESIIEDGHVARGWLGAGIQDLTDDLSESFGFEGTDGVLVGDVVPDGPADLTGLKPGDIIVEFAGEATPSANQLRNAVAATSPDTGTSILVFRNGEHLNLDVTVGLLEPERLASLHGGSTTTLGMELTPITPEVAKQLGREHDAQGLVVTQVVPDSLADRAGIRPKDIVVSVNGQTVETLADLRDATSDDEDRGVRLQVERDGLRRFVFIRS